MSKHKNLAVTEAASQAAKSLSAWGAVEAQAEKMLHAVQNTQAKGDFAELHFNGDHVQGVVKVGNFVMKIES
jgi:hypothetical protein